MALKQYELYGSTYQFEEGQQPKDAVPFEKAAPAPSNKARTAPNKRPKTKAPEGATPTNIEDASDPDATE